jgi:hypothetical protein
MLLERAAALSGRSTAAVKQQHNASSLLLHDGDLTASSAVSGGISEEPSLPTAEVTEQQITVRILQAVFAYSCVRLLALVALLVLSTCLLLVQY